MPPPQRREPIQLYVGGISPQIEAHHLRELYEPFGVMEIIMKSRYAFVEFNELKDAEAAIAETNKVQFRGCKLVVEQPSK